MSEKQVARRSRRAPDRRVSVDRGAETAAVTRLLCDGALVSIVGAMGAGKTRLAEQVAAEFASDRSSRAVCWLGLRDLGPDASVHDELRRCLDGLGVADHAGTLLVLDGTDSPVGDLRSAVRAVFGERDSVVVLTTGLGPIGLEGETLFPLGPLPTPDHGAPFQELRAAPAVALFEECAREVQPDFEITAENVGAVLDIVRGTDGMPGAIAIAAAHARALPLTRVRDLVRSSLIDLTLPHESNGGASPYRPRIQRCYDESSDEARLIWRRASVFADAFTLDALAAACADSALDTLRFTRGVTALVDAGVLLRARDRDDRYRLLTAAKQLVASMTDDEEERLAWTGVGQFFVELADQASGALVGPDHAHWNKRLQEQSVNLVEALAALATTEQGRRDLATLLAKLRRYWVTTGQLPFARTWLRTALSEPDPPSEERVIGHLADAHCAALAGDLAAAERALSAMTFERERLGDGPEHPFGDLVRALIAERKLDTRSTLKLTESAMRAAKQQGYEPSQIAELYFFIALFTLNDSPEAVVTDRAEHLAMEAMQIFSQLGSMWGQAMIMSVFVEVSRRRDEIAEALDTARDALRLMRDVGDKAMSILLLEQIGALEIARGRFPRAIQILVPVYEDNLLARPPLHGEFSGRKDEIVAALGADRFAQACDDAAEAGLDAAFVLAMRDEPGEADAIRHHRESFYSLSAREREVAGLVAQGYSNPRIAAQLYLSRRTVEGHVQRILAKLQFQSRTQIGVWYTECFLDRPRADDVLPLSEDDAPADPEVLAAIQARYA